MAIDLTNMVLVHRQWTSLPDSDLIAVFESDIDANHFVAAYEWIDDKTPIRLVVTNTFDGKQSVRVLPARPEGGENG